MHRSRVGIAFFLASSSALLLLSACSSDSVDSADTARMPTNFWASGATGATAAISLPERRPDVTVIIESIKANELVVIEVPQTERQSGSGARTGTGMAQSGGGASPARSASLLGGTSGGRWGGGFGGGGPPGMGGGGNSQSTSELETLLKSGKRLRVRIPIGIPVAVAATATGSASGREAGSFSDIRTGYRASLWLNSSNTGAIKSAEAIMLLGKVSR